MFFTVCIQHKFQTKYTYIGCAASGVDEEEEVVAAAAEGVVR